MTTWTRADLLARDCYPVGQLPRAVELPCGCRYVTWTGPFPKPSEIDLTCCNLHVAEQDMAEEIARDHCGAVMLVRVGTWSWDADPEYRQAPDLYCRLCSTQTEPVQFPCPVADRPRTIFEATRKRLENVRSALGNIPAVPMPEVAEYQRLLQLGIVHGCRGRPFGAWCTNQPSRDGADEPCRRCSAMREDPGQAGSRGECTA